LPRHAELRAWRQSQGGAAALQLLRSQAPEHMGMALLQILVFDENCLLRIVENRDF
jgi:hypothetical protein